MSFIRVPLFKLAERNKNKSRKRTVILNGQITVGSLHHISGFLPCNGHGIFGVLYCQKVYPHSADHGHRNSVRKCISIVIHAIVYTMLPAIVLSYRMHDYCIVAMIMLIFVNGVVKKFFPCDGLVKIGFIW